MFLLTIFVGLLAMKHSDSAIFIAYIDGKQLLTSFVKMARHAERYPTKRAGSGERAFRLWL